MLWYLFFRQWTVVTGFVSGVGDRAGIGMSNASPIGMEIIGLSPVEMDFRGPGRATRMQTPDLYEYFLNKTLIFYVILMFLNQKLNWNSERSEREVKKPNDLGFEPPQAPGEFSWGAAR